MYQSSISTTQYEQIAPIVKMVLSQIESERQTTAAAIDGQLTLEDVKVGFYIVGGMAGCGILLHFANIATGVPWDDSIHHIRIYTQWGVYVMALRWTADALDLPVWIDAFFGRALKWLEEQRHKQPEPVRERHYSIIYGDPDDKKDVVRLYELPNGRKVEWTALVNFLETAVQHTHGENRKAWARESWVGKEYLGYPNLGRLTFQQWSGIRQLCKETEARYTAYAGLWRTDDVGLVGDFIDMLDREDG